MELKIGDKVKYDCDNSILTWYGFIEKICPKTVIIKESESLRSRRIKIKDIVCVY